MTASNDLTTRIRASMLRQKLLRGASDALRDILSVMTDEELCEQDTLHHQAARNQEKQKTPILKSVALSLSRVQVL